MNTSNETEPALTITLPGFIRMLKHSWPLIMACVIVCGLIGAIFGLTKAVDNSDTAKATIVASSQVGGIGALATAEAAAYTGENSDSTEIKVSILTDRNAIEITAEAESRDEIPKAVEAVNRVARETEKKAHDLFDMDITIRGNSLTVQQGQESSLSIYENDIQLEVVEATESASDNKTSSKSTLVKYGLAGFFVGLIIGICIILVRDITKRPIRNAREAALAYGLPILRRADGPESPELFATNISFAANKDVHSLCVVPVGAEADAQLVAQELSRSDEFSVHPVPPITASAEAAKAAAESDAVVVVLREWKNSLGQLEACVDELVLVQAPVVGIAALGEKTCA